MEVDVRRTMILLDPDLGAAKARKADTTSEGAVAPHSPSSTIPSSIPWKERVPTVRTLARFLRAAQQAVRLRGQVSVLLTTDKAIRRLNRQFRGKDKATDVLSFPAESGFVGAEIAGDLAISVPTALQQAREQGHALSCELKILLLHGLLHLAGYDHEADEGQMARRERTLRQKLRLPVGLIERAGKTAAAGKTAMKKSAPDRPGQKKPAASKPARPARRGR
jgi:probable rRNA maturation factor